MLLRNQNYYCMAALLQEHRFRGGAAAEGQGGRSTQEAHLAGLCFAETTSPALFCLGRH